MVKELQDHKLFFLTLKGQDKFFNYRHHINNRNKMPQNIFAVWKELKSPRATAWLLRALMQTVPYICDLYKVHKTWIHLVYFKSIFHRVYIIPPLDIFQDIIFIHDYYKKHLNPLQKQYKECSLMFQGSFFPDRLKFIRKVIFQDRI